MIPLVWMIGWVTTPLSSPYFTPKIQSDKTWRLSEPAAVIHGWYKSQGNVLVKERQVQHSFASVCHFCQGCCSVISTSCEGLWFALDLVSRLLLKHLQRLLAPIVARPRIASLTFMAQKFAVEFELLSRNSHNWSLGGPSLVPPPLSVNWGLLATSALVAHRGMHPGAISPPLLHTLYFTWWRETVLVLFLPSKTRLRRGPYS